jgi:general secretion pathway protein D
MKSVFKPYTRALLLSVTTAALLATSVHADCTYELFNISSVKGTSVGEFIDQISDECGMSVIVADAEAENILKKQMNKTYLKNLTINEVLDLIVKENDLQYTLQNNILKISYLTTKTYNIDYIISTRKGEGSANVTLSSQTSTSSSLGSTSSSGTTGAKAGATSQSGINITSTDEVLFWDTLEKEVKNILSRPEDQYKQTSSSLEMDSKDKSVSTNDQFGIFINKGAGLITVTGTGKQIKRLDTYIDDLEKKMQAQVLIDVKMYSVIFNDGSTTGIDWSQLYALQNIDLTFDYQSTKDVTKYTSTALNTGTEITETILPNGRSGSANIFRLGASGSLKEVIKFLKTQGDVYSISNPKILTLNNQPALVTAGTELFYSIDSSTTSVGTASAPIVGNTRTVSSVFSGVLLDITPEISSDGTITLRINPSISETASTIDSNNAERTMPPDLTRRQMSSVIRVQDGNRVILGGLINTKNIQDNNKVPLLGDVPWLGYLFKREGMSKRTEEIVIIIEPHIVKKDGSNVGLSDLGYSRLSPAMEKDQLKQNEDAKIDNRDIKEMKEDTK